jgi:hypothetical protein
MNDDGKIANYQEHPALPLILAGPILRKTTLKEVNLWLVSSSAIDLTPVFSLQSDLTLPLVSQNKHQVIKVSNKLFIHLLTCCPQDLEFPVDQLVHYSLDIQSEEGASKQSLLALLPDMFYPEQSSLSFFIPSEVSSLFFGSCRNPHHPSKDTFVVADAHIEKHLIDLKQRPCVLLHGGDQVYVDDIGGPTLKAIHRLISILGLVDESLPDTITNHTDCLYNDEKTFYNRQSILPKVTFKSRKLFSKLAPFRRTMPVFSSVKAENHLISIAEFICLYLLVWSPECWRLVERETNNLPSGLNRAHKIKFKQELMALRAFIDGLGQVRRMMAHISNYMIFDDHDVTDDWNLTAQWEQNVYSNPFSKRVISNALLSYWIFQGWGNTPERFDEDFVGLIEQVVSTNEKQKVEQLEKTLLEYAHWHYEIDLNPVMVVLDTRTHRWRSERSMKNPSGLLDWERLSELEDVLINKEAGIIVSPAPIFGVKFIETIQRVFTFFGHELTVDAENWMAHPGSAKKLLRIFRRIDTPDEIIVLSGDVHYSFCFSAKQRFRENATTIWQLTSSGFKNEFPLPLIKTFDLLERMLYFAASPFNIFTKRRTLQIEQKALQQTKKQILISKSNIGLVEFENKKLKAFRILIEVDEEKRFL